MDDKDAELADSLVYFWQEKGDLERLAGFDKATIGKKFPEVLRAWEDYTYARTVMDLIIRDLKGKLPF